MQALNTFFLFNLFAQRWRPKRNWAAIFDCHFLSLHFFGKYMECVLVLYKNVF